MKAQLLWHAKVCGNNLVNILFIFYFFSNDHLVLNRTILIFFMDYELDMKDINKTGSHEIGPIY